MAISTFMGLETNKRGLTAQQTSLYTVGHNISNANTVGYTRQRVNLEATHGFPGIGRNAPMIPGHLGTGVTGQSVTRIRNEFVDKQYRQATNNLGYWSQRTDAISQMEDIMSEPSTYGLNAALNDFYSSWQELANSPKSAAARQVVYTKASHLASSFNYMHKQMSQVQTNLKYEALNTVDKVNSILGQIATLNNQIKQVEPNGYIPNDLYDARDVLIDELSGYLPISTERVFSGGLATDDAEGALNVYLVKADGTKQALVSAEQTGTQTYNGQERNLYGESIATKLTLSTTGGAAVTKSDIFQAITGLSFATTETVNTTSTINGNTTVYNDKEGNPLYTAVKDPATGIVTYTDTATPPNVFTATPTPGTTDMTFTNANGDIVAKSTTNATTGLTIVADPAGVEIARLSPVKDASGNITGETITQTITTVTGTVDINNIQADKGNLKSYADTYGYVDATGKTQGFLHEKMAELDKLANEFATSFNTLHQSGYGLSSNGIAPSPTGLDFFDKIADPNSPNALTFTAANLKVSDKMQDFNNIAASTANNEEGNGNLALTLSNLKTVSLAGLGDTSAQKYYEAMVAAVGTEGEKAVKEAYTAGTVHLTISNNRSSISSVSLDEEMTNMIMFQQAYNASARMMTAIDETLEKIINGMGRVGL